MKQLLKNRTLIGVTVILLSILLFFGVGPYFTGQASKQVQITRIAKDVGKDTKITDDMLETTNVSAKSVPTDAITDRSSIVGKYSKTERKPHDWVFSSTLSDQPLGADEYLSKLDGKKVAVSVKIKDFANGLSGKLETGDVISLDVVDYSDMKQTISNGALQYVKLLAATTDTGSDNDRSEAQENDKKSDSNSSTKQDMPSTLTVLVTPDQKKLLEDYNANGTIHAALVYRGDSTKAQAFLDEQDKYLANHQGGNSNE